LREGYVQKHRKYGGSSKGGAKPLDEDQRREKRPEELESRPLLSSTRGPEWYRKAAKINPGKRLLTEVGRGGKSLSRLAD